LIARAGGSKQGDPERRLHDGEDRRAAHLTQELAGRDTTTGFDPAVAQSHQDFGDERLVRRHSRPAVSDEEGNVAPGPKVEEPRPGSPEGRPGRCPGARGTTVASPGRRGAIALRSRLAAAGSTPSS